MRLSISLDQDSMHDLVRIRNLTQRKANDSETIRIALRLASVALEGRCFDGNVLSSVLTLARLGLSSVRQPDPVDLDLT